MAPKKNDPLYGYEGQPPEYTLANGNTLGAGDLVEQAAQRYHQANPGLDASQVSMAWNNLDDARRRDGHAALARAQLGADDAARQRLRFGLGGGGRA